MKTLIPAIIVTFLLFSPSVIFAEKNNASPNDRGNKSNSVVFAPENKNNSSVSERVRMRLEEAKKEKETMRLEIQNRLEDKKASRSAKLEAKKQELIQQYFNQLSERINATIDRLNKLIDRIESRITIINKDNPSVDTSEITGELDKAKTLLDDSSVQLSAASGNLDTVLSSNDPKQAFEIIRTSIIDIKKNLVKVHSMLVHTISDIKGLRIGNTTTNSSTSSGTTNLETQNGEN